LKLNCDETLSSFAFIFNLRRYNEVKLLKHINEKDPGDSKNLLRLYDYFYHRQGRTDHPPHVMR